MSPARQIESKAQSVGELLRRPFSYKVPSYQRDYSWTADEIQSLWNDVITAHEEERAEYFLGAIVFTPAKDKENALEIVDGQQRLASLTMILAAIRTSWRAMGDNDRADGITTDYLGSKDRRTKELVPKLALNETNDPIFQAVVFEGKAFSAAERKLWSKSNLLLYDAFQRIQAKLREWESKDPDKVEALIALEEYIAKNTMTIVIQVGDEYDAFVIFETLNDRGLELAVSDLVKNYLFSYAESHIESFKKVWSEISVILGSEHLTTFLRHLWMSEVELVRERDLYRKLREKVKTKTQVRQYVDRIRKAADLYAALTSVDHAYWSDFDDETRTYLETLRLFRATQFRPLALAVMDGGDNAQVKSMLRSVLMTTFRYTVVGKRSAAELERVYSDAALAVRKTNKRNAKTIVDLLRSAYVDDSKFSEDFAARGFDKADVARYVLSALERRLSGDQERVAARELTLEHVLPKNPGSSWKIRVPKGEELEDYTDLIGNLTLLEKGKNRKLGNQDFVGKKKILSSSKLTLNDTVLSRSNWDLEAIKKRSVALAKEACNIWRLDH